MISIRPALPNDLDAVMAIAAYWHTLPPWNREHFRTELDGERYYFCVAEDGGLVVGFGGILVIAPEAQVTTVAVRPESAKQGLGRRLMLHLHEEARRRACNLMSLEVGEANASARALYDSLGYQAVGRRKKYYPDGTDALLLTLRLL